MHKKLYRSDTDKIFAGVCGGIAEYFAIDVTLLRLFWMLVVIFTGIFPGVIAYILAIFIMPLPPRSHESKREESAEKHHSQHHPDAE